MVALLLGASTTYAQPNKPDPQTLRVVRRLGREGLDLLRQKNFAEAFDRFDRADKLIPTPTLGLRAALCLIELERWVEASERLLEVIRTDLTASSPRVHRKAVEDARKERDKLLPTIPNITIITKGPHGKGIAILLDKNPMPVELLGEQQPIDPGKHEVRVRRGSNTVTEMADLAPGDDVRIVVRLPPLDPDELPPKVDKPNPYQTWVHVAFGVGGGGLLAGLINGGIALNQRSKLLDVCPNRDCPPDQHDLAGAFDATRVATTLGFIMAGAGAAAGTTLLLLPSDDREAASESWGFVLHPGAVGVRGTW